MQSGSNSQHHTAQLQSCDYSSHPIRTRDLSPRTDTGNSYIQPELLEAAELLKELERHAQSERRESLAIVDVDGHSDHTRLSRPHKRSRGFSLYRAEHTGDAF